MKIKIRFVDNVITYQNVESYQLASAGCVGILVIHYDEYKIDYHRMKYIKSFTVTTDEKKED